MMKRNYQKELETIIDNCVKEGMVPRLLLHSCCAPCSTYVLEYLSNYFSITVFYYNPNIYPVEEYHFRAKEQQQLIEGLQVKHPITFLEGTFEQKEFYDAVKGKEKIKEGGERCFACYKLRLEESVRAAKEGGYDFVTTTLTISPLKNAQELNNQLEDLCKKHGVTYLPSDFKKKNGYKRSVELSKELQLYRQDYCGCIFSKNEREYQNSLS